MKNKCRGQILLQGRSEDGLYPIYLSHSMNKVMSPIAFIGYTITTSHIRLGHPTTSVFKKLKSLASLPVFKSVVIESYQMAKSKCLLFFYSTHVTSKPLEIIHSYLWISHVYAHNGCKYYIVSLTIFLISLRSIQCTLKLKHLNDLSSLNV